ncbi:MAG: macro domain-containing protein [Mycoplasmoidaceae bacterium]
MLNNKMTIYLLDKEPVVTTAWQQYFQNEKDVKIITGDFKSFMDKYKVDCVVSPGNSKGIMNGGYDYAISDYFGWELTKKVQAYIVKNYKGIQQVGSAFIIDIPGSKIKLIHSPTMISPSIIKNTKVVKDCMYSTLKVAMDNKIKSIVIPAFGGATGRVAPYELAKLMYEAYNQIKKEA